MKTHIYTCLDCGKEFEWKGWKPEHKRRCIECAFKRVEQAAQQLHDKSGPFYESWRRGVKRAARRL